jgi:hypothetical protein
MPALRTFVLAVLCLSTSFAFTAARATAEEAGDADKSAVEKIEDFFQKNKKPAQDKKKKKKTDDADADDTDTAMNADEAEEAPKPEPKPEKKADKKASKSKGGWFDLIKGGLEGKDGASPSLGSTVFSNDELRQAFKESLTQGVTKAIKELGREDGYFKSIDVKIPVPEELEPAEKALNLLGQEKYVNDFVLRMNRAAETAVPSVVDIFADAILAMTFDDVQKIFKGSKDEATQFFKRTSSKKLNEKILPIVKKMTDKAGVTSSYKKFSKKANALAEAVGREVPDLDIYVTGKAVDGLFFMIAKEEAEIRANPAARTTDLLKKVFGSK